MQLAKKMGWLVLVLAGIIYLIIGDEGTKKWATDFDHWILDDQLESSEKPLPDRHKDPVSNQDITSWIGKRQEQLQEAFGKPDRKDPTPYGYEWWIYSKDDIYLQFGVQSGEIVTSYGTGVSATLSPFQIGMSYQELVDRYDFSKTISFQSYRFHLTEEDLMKRPLMQWNDRIFVQLYFDSFEQRLSSIRVMTLDILLMQQPYELSYWGNLPEKRVVAEDRWESIECGTEQQIFDITNMIRKRFRRNQLKWNEEISQIAFAHSVDMEENHYFSHYSPDGKGLKDRLRAKEMMYEYAGENIAAQYVDGASAVEGWLNSEGHRQALLNNAYTELGVGVYHTHYTQNFLKP